MTDLLFEQFLIPFFIRFFFIGGLLALAVGLALVLAPQRMHQVHETMNRWVSLRHGMKWLEVPRDVDAPLYRFFRRALLPIVALVLYSTFILSTQVQARTAVAALGVDRALDASLAQILLETLRWFLEFGGAFVVALAIVLRFFPHTLPAIERRANRWLSTRNWLKGLDVMHMGIDTWLRRHPRATGLLVATGALVVSLTFGLMLLAPR